MGEHRELSGFWVAEAVWVTHSAGVAKATAEWIVDGTPVIDVHECDLYRFEDVGQQPRVHHADQLAGVRRGLRHHPSATSSASAPRGLRTSPFYARQKRARRILLRGRRAGNARPGSRRTPNWRNGFATTDCRSPSATTGRREFWSPISIAEAHWTRERVAMYDMTPLTRYEVAGAGAAASCSG